MGQLAIYHTAVKRVRNSAKTFAWWTKIFAFKPKVKTVAEKLSFVLRLWPGNLLMDILRYSQLVIFSHITTFIKFSYKSKVRKGGNRKWRWISAFDRCVAIYKTWYNCVLRKQRVWEVSHSNVSDYMLSWYNVFKWTSYCRLKRFIWVIKCL